MKTKRILGYLFMGLSVLMALAIVGQLLTLVRDVLAVFYIFTGKVDAYKAGYIMGRLAYWIFHFWATYKLWTTGRKWSKKSVATWQPSADA